MHDGRRRGRHLEGTSKTRSLWLQAQRISAYILLQAASGQPSQRGAATRPKAQQQAGRRPEPAPAEARAAPRQELRQETEKQLARRKRRWGHQSVDTFIPHVDLISAVSKMAGMQQPKHARTRAGGGRGFLCVVRERIRTFERSRVPHDRGVFFWGVLWECCSGAWRGHGGAQRAWREHGGTSEHSERWAQLPVEARRRYDRVRRGHGGGTVGARRVHYGDPT